MMLRKLLKGPNVNRVVKFFVFADLLLFAGWGVVNPIFSIFIIDEIVGATLPTVGIASALYWFARSITQPSLARMLDKREGEKDDLYVLIAGLLGMSLFAFIFTLISTIPQLYILQFVHGVAVGAYSDSWSAIFSRHLDKKRFAFDWSLDRSAISIATAITGLSGGFLASAFGFDVTFVIAGVFTFISAIVIFTVPSLVLPSIKGEREPFPIHVARRHGHGNQSIH